MFRTPARRAADARTAAFAREFGDALRAAETSMAAAIIARALEAGLPAAAIHSRVMAPALHRIGSLWEQGAITIADEHLATAICERMLISLYAPLQHGPIATPTRVLLAAVQGEHHALGLRMAADVLEGAGYDVVHLGADVPTDALLGATERHRPDLIALCLTMPTGVGHLDRALHGIQGAHPDLPILLGGQGVVGRLRSAGWPYVEHTDEMLRTVAHLVSTPGEMPTAPDWREVHTDETDSPTPLGVGTTEARLASIVREASDLARHQAQRARSLYDAAFRDPLTSLPNRRALADRVSDGIAADEVMLMIELDDLEAVNEAYGPVEGDLILHEVADVMRDALRLGDFAARSGGGEFTVVLSPCTSAQARTVAERLRRSAEATLAERDVTLSIGAAAGGDARTVERAGQALRRARRAGGNRVDANG